MPTISEIIASRKQQPQGGNSLASIINSKRQEDLRTIGDSGILGDFSFDPTNPVMRERVLDTLDPSRVSSRKAETSVRQFSQTGSTEGMPQFRQGPVPSKGILDRIPGRVGEFLREGRDVFAEGLFGNERDRAAGLVPDTFSSYIQGQQGLLPFVGRTQRERIQVLEDSLKRRGVEPARATEIAVLDILSREEQTSKGNIPSELVGQGPATQRLEELGITKQEQRAINLARLGQGVGSLLDVAGLIPIGSISSKVPGLARLLQGAKTTDKAADALRGAGITDDLIRIYAPKFAKLDDIAEIEKGLDALEGAIKGTGRAVDKVPAPKVPSKTGKVAPKPVERGFVTSAKEAVPELKIAGQYIPRSTDDLSIKAKNLITSDINQAERIALTASDDVAVATASELIKHYNKLAKAAKTTAESNVFYDKAGDVAVNLAPKLTEQGRAIQAAAILGRMTPEGQLRFAAKTIDKYNEGVEATRGGLLGLRKPVPQLTGEQTKNILQRMEKINKMEDGVEKAIAFKSLQDEIARLVPSPWWKKAINLWKAGLLTGIKTSGLNTLSNLFHGVSEVAKDIPATAVDKAASLFTGKRTLGLTTKGTRGGIAEGYKNGIRYMKTGYDERQAAIKLDWRKVNYGDGKVAKGLQKYEEFIFQLMGAEDAPFYYGAKSRSLASQAIAQGKNQKLKGKKLQEFVQNLVENPTDDMLKNAVNDAEVAVFQNRTVLGDVARGIQRIPGGEIVLPFGRTPSAVAMQIVNYSPVGIVKTIIQNIGKGRFNQRAFSQGLGRGITGTGVLAIGMSLFDNDMVSLDRPTNEREQKQWELEGRKPNSIKVGDKWRSVLVLGPAGMQLILGAQLQKALQTSGSYAEALSEASFASLKSFTEQTFLVGVNQFANALNDPERYGGSVISRLIGSTIPTIISDVARATDDVERSSFYRTEGFLAPLKSRIPGLRQTLEPQMDVFGTPLEVSGNAIETMIDPSRPSRIKSSATIEELKRLFEAGHPATPTRFADERIYTDLLTPEQITSLQENAGQVLESKLERLFASSAYKQMSDEKKAKTVQAFTDRARLDARALMVEELTQDLDGEDLRDRLRELKESGFMTEGVFNRWEELF